METGWRLGTVNPVEMQLDSVFRVVRVLVDGKPNTRLSRTMYARQGSQVLVPHEKAPGDTLTTRVRYHGIPRGGFRVGLDRTGARGLAGESGGGLAPLWLPVPAGDPPRVTVVWNVQASEGQRVIASGVLTSVDTLSYGHTTWHYRLDTPAPLDRLAVASGRYAVTTLAAPALPGCLRPGDPVDVARGFGGGRPGRVPPRGRHGGLHERAAGRVSVPRSGPRGLAASPRRPADRVGRAVRRSAGARGRGHGGRHRTGDRRPMAGQRGERQRGCDDGPSAATASYLALLWTRQDTPRPTGMMLTRDVDAIRRLHQMVGDSAFFRGLRHYVETNRHAPAAPGAFERAMAEAAGKPLDWSWRAAVGTR